MTARRCTRGHFIPATAESDACRCVLVPRQRRAYHFGADLTGQGLRGRGKSIRTVWPAGSYL